MASKPEPDVEELDALRAEELPASDHTHGQWPVTALLHYHLQACIFDLD
jgi:hypothetical protein